MKPKVSIVIPVYNTEHYLKQCLETLCLQTVKEIQIICVDDGSTDGSVDIIKHFMESDDRIELYFHKGNGLGAGAARNCGLQYVTGEYLLILDSDDYFELDLVEKSYNKAKSLEADVVLYDTTFIDENGMHLRGYNTLNTNAIPDMDVFSLYDCPDTFFQITPGMAWSKMWKTDFIKSNNILFQENIPMADDILFTYSALSCAKRIVALKNRLINYRYVRVGNQSSNKDKAVTSSVEYALELKKFLIEHDLYDILRYSFIRTTIERSISHLRTFNSIESFEILYSALKEYIQKEIICDCEWKKYFDTSSTNFINDKAKQQLYTNINNVISLSSREFLYEQYKEKIFLGANFPQNLVSPTDKVIIYGAGDVGKAYFNQNMRYNYCKVIAWADKAYSEIGFPVISPDHIKKMEYDKVIIAVEKENVADIIKKELTRIGIKEECIFWQYPFVTISK